MSKLGLTKQAREDLAVAGLAGGALFALVAVLFVVSLVFTTLFVYAGWNLGVDAVADVNDISLAEAFGLALIIRVVKGVLRAFSPTVTATTKG